MLHIGRLISSEELPELSLISLSLTPSNSQPYNHKPSSYTPVYKFTFPCSKLDTSLSSSIAYFSCLADRCLKAFRNVSGWKRSLRFTDYFKSCCCCTLWIHPLRALAFLVTSLIHELGFVGPSQILHQVVLMSPNNKLLAILSVSGVSISTP